MISIFQFSNCEIEKMAVVIKDIDGNMYDTVTIGNQTWFKENLKVTRYNNGDSINNVTNDSQWFNRTSGGYCIYDHDTNQGNTYGNLYNFYTVIDSRGLCPANWHVPTNDDWKELADFVAPDSTAGIRLKESGFSHWNHPLDDIPKATNETGFTALPGGWKRFYGSTDNLGNMGFWWSTEFEGDSAFYQALGFHHNLFFQGKIDNEFGLSVRCIQD